MINHKTAVLVVAFNRPKLLTNLLEVLIGIDKIRLYVAIDGPRIGNFKDRILVEECLKVVNDLKIDFEIDVLTREINLGVRKGIPDAINWVFQNNCEVIIVEEDVIPTLECINFLINNLDMHKNDKKIGHISGYNLVPESEIKNPFETARLSNYPESFCWATWKDRWCLYSDELKKHHELKVLKVDFMERIYWSLCFYQARLNLVDTWAYRWVFSLWSHGLVCISPNRNLSTYHGWANGTHTFKKARFDEPKLGVVDNLATREFGMDVDIKADKYLKKMIFKITLVGLFTKLLETIILFIVKKIKLDKVNQKLFRFHRAV
jgi:hypothetical protein